MVMGPFTPLPGPAAIPMRVRRGSGTRMVLQGRLNEIDPSDVSGGGVSMALRTRATRRDRQARLAGWSRRPAAVARPFLDPILVIDDDPECGWMTAEMLERAGHRVEWTVAPDFALPRIRERRYALVASDVNMPRLCGTQLAAAAAAVRPAVPVLLISGAADARARITARTLGVALLAKPFRAETLIAAVRTLLAPPPERRAYGA